MQTSRDTSDLWSARHRDCHADPVDLDPDLARFLCATHAGHGPDCRQYLAAAAFCFGHADAET